VSSLAGSSVLASGFVRGSAQDVDRIGALVMERRTSFGIRLGKKSQE